MPNRTANSWLWLAFPAAAGLLSLVVLRKALTAPLEFDDAYMFYRYGLNILGGLGIAWNPDGAPTYGMTSQLWVWLVLPFTFLPLGPGAALQLASWLTGIAALVTMGCAVARHSGSTYFRSKPLAIAFVALPLLVNPNFAYQMTTGMDTMLSLLANSLFVWALLEHREARADRWGGYLVGLLGFVAFLARPENGLCALAVPLLVRTNSSEAWRCRDLVGTLALPAILIATDLLCCRWYFGVALPLSFYAKAMHGYAGFQNRENAVEYLFEGLSCGMPFLALACAASTPDGTKRLAAFLLPVAATFVYLLTVRQVMGFHGRYFVPFLPFLIAPTLPRADALVASDARRAALRLGMAILTLFALILATGPLRQRAQEAYLRLIVPEPIPVPSLAIAARERLPKVGWFAAIEHFSDDIVAQLPPGARIAASEVGYLGSASSRLEIIDLVGLNDTRIGTRGLSMDDLLARAPDLIWLPHWDYTGLRETMLTDPRLIERYRLIDGAFNYGIAIRCDSPFRTRIQAALRVAWAALYPARTLEAYIGEPRNSESNHCSS